MNDNTFTALISIAMIGAPAALSLAGSDGEEISEQLCIAQDEAPVHRTLRGTGDIKARLDKGDKVVAVVAAEHWRFIAFASNDQLTDGWIIDRYLEPCADTEETGEGPAVQDEEVGGDEPTAGLSSDEIRVHTIDIGTGSCHIIECPDAAPIVFDCGATKRSDDMDDQHLADYGNAIFTASSLPPRVVISHADRDHISLVAQLMGERPAGEIWLGGVRNQYVHAAFERWLETQEQANVPIHVGSIELGEQPDLACGTATATIAAANAGSTKNDNSIVLRLDHRDVSFMLTGDATRFSQDQALSTLGNEAATTIVMGSHHGADTEGSNAGSWAQAVNPEVMIYSAGTSYGHPRCRITANYQSGLADANAHPTHCGKSNDEYAATTDTTRAEYVTDVVGTVVVTSNGKGYDIQCSKAHDCF